MPTYQTLLPERTYQADGVSPSVLSSTIYSFLDKMAVLYSQIEREMHVAIVSGEKLSVIEKQLQSRYQVDSTTTRNVYHNLKGKHQGIKELRKNQVKDLKSTIKSIQSAIKKRL
ncbi:MAG: hypothetical protein QNJ41_27585, partial [Xenococcaceae cyanobacterium MO_188.B32]|nr:hypothetical protein [Xenococcaceae cyanobacterium MO_188.B32]